MAKVGPRIQNHAGMHRHGRSGNAEAWRRSCSSMRSRRWLSATLTARATVIFPPTGRWASRVCGRKACPPRCRANITPPRFGSGQYKGCRAYVDYRELYGKEDVDAVMIATRANAHAVIALDVLHRRKHLYCEKPLRTWSVEKPGVSPRPPAAPGSPHSSATTGRPRPRPASPAS